MDGDNRTDEQLMSIYRDGDTQAFELLYQRHRVSLYNYLMRQCSDKAIADELFQDSWTSLIRARQTYTESAKFSTYLFRIAHNKLIDYYRRKSKAAIDSYEDDIQDISSHSPEDTVSAQQQHNKFIQLLEQLPEAQREVFLLKEETGLGLEDIARITQSNVEAVKSRLRYAIKRLKTGMEDLS
ncbi:MAG: sigma-70 family RNA polymerase sigma factor [Gammaproteobacteria bacterium]